MTYCTKCGNEIGSNARFCSVCGAPASQGSCQCRGAYEGVVHRCPNCGETISAFLQTCPSCGLELRDVKAAGCVSELAAELKTTDNIEDKHELIINFHIPNTREDIIEFFILASSNIEAGGDSTEAWYAKLDQAYRKAMLVLDEGPELIKIKQTYSKLAHSRAKNSIMASLSHNHRLQCALLLLMGLALLFVGTTLGTASGDPNSPFYVLAAFGIFPVCAAVVILLYIMRGDIR